MQAWTPADSYGGCNALIEGAFDAEIVPCPCS
jgi:hypothetical protein